MPGGKNSLNSHRRHSRTSANHFPTGYHWVITRPATSPGSGTPHTFPWQRSGCRRSTWALMARAYLSASSLWFLDKRPLEFLSLWKSMGLYFFFRRYFLCFAMTSSGELRSKYYIAGCCVCFGGGGGKRVISNTSGPRRDLSLCMSSFLVDKSRCSYYLSGI